MAAQISKSLAPVLARPTTKIIAGIDLTKNRFDNPRYVGFLDALNIMGFDTPYKPIILEIAETSVINNVKEALNKLQLPIEYVIDFLKIKVISTWATEDNIYELSSNDAIKKIHYNNIKYLHEYEFPFVNFMSTMISNVTGTETRKFKIKSRYEDRKKPGDIPTGALFEALGADKYWIEGYTGRSLHGAIIDSGFSSNRMLTRGEVGRMSIRAVDPGDYIGHGAFVLNLFRGNPITLSTGQVLRGLTRCSATSIKALFGGRGRDAGILLALQKAVELGVDGINLSLGGKATVSAEESLLCQACKQIAEEEKILVFVSAGNDGEQNSVNDPGIEPSVITVGSCSFIQYLENGNVRRSFYSSYGPEVNCVSFGGGQPNEEDELDENILNGTSPLSVIDNLDMIPNMIGSGKGTSWSAPNAFGIAMLGREKYFDKTGEKLSNIEILKILKDYGTEFDDEIGNGLFNRDLLNNFI